MALPTVQQILDKRAAGIKLTKSEAAKLSHVGRARRAPAGPAAVTPGSGANVGTPPLAGRVGDAGPAEVLAPPPVDPELCKATAAQLLNTADDATLAWLESLATRAGADATTWRAFRERAELKPGAKLVLVDTSPHWLPKLLRTFGFEVGSAPSFLAGIALLNWGFGVVSVSAVLKKKAKEREAQPQPKPTTKDEPRRTH